MDIQNLDCDKIVFHAEDDTTRSFRKEDADLLAMSIEAEGMYHPIAVRADPDKPGYFRGVQGRHRLHAQHRILGRTTILCNVLVMDDEEAAIASVTENAFRKVLGRAERAKFLLAWHAMFAAKHPERIGRGKAGLAAIRARADTRKAAKARGENGARDQKTKLNRRSSAGMVVAGGGNQKANLGFRADECAAETEAEAVTDAKDLRDEADCESVGGDTGGEDAPANFTQTLAATLGCSESTAKREFRIALNLTSQQLQVCDKWKLSKGQVDSIAAIKNETERAEVIDLIAFGLDFENAWAQADPDARKATGKSHDREEAEAAAEQETRPGLSDDEWFASSCGAKAASLGSPAGYKADALLFRGVTGPRHLFRAEVKGALNNAQAAKVVGPFHDLVRRFVSAGHPRDWPLCDGCGGSGVGVNRGGARCTTCRGAGYLLVLKNPSGESTTGAGEGREDRAASPVKGLITGARTSDLAPQGDRASGGKPGRPGAPAPVTVGGEAELLAMFARFAKDAPEGWPEGEWDEEAGSEEE